MSWPTVPARPTRWRPNCSWRSARHRAAAEAPAPGWAFSTEAAGRFQNTPSRPRSWSRAARPSWATSSATATSSTAPGASSSRLAARRQAGAARRGLPGRRPGAHARLRAGDARARARHRARAGRPARPAGRRAACSTSAVGRAPTRCCSPSDLPGLRSEVLELPGVAAVARELVAVRRRQPTAWCCATATTTSSDFGSRQGRGADVGHVPPRDPRPPAAG
jgi:hypothetical protein